MSAQPSRDVEAVLDVAEVLERFTAEEDERVERGRCACGCEERISTKAGQRYLTDRHRGRRHRARLKAVAETRGVRVHQSLQSLRESNPTSDRRDDAQAPRKRAQARPRQGVTVYLPTVAAAEVVLE